ncbi:MAG TPA: hypothetical protein VI732_05205 [Alphaproteobacteria bacterium]|jgi:hypothetical protein|nr:hypothetical protein [Alphaproteobacteria bacterium]
MSPAKLVALRLFNMTLGHSARFNKWLHRALVFLFVEKAKGNARYMASSRFFEPGELD